jgi:MATE family multidrug resistance protein
MDVLRWATPGMMVGIGMMRAFLPAIGQGTAMLWAALGATGINAALCWGLIHGAWGLPALGMRGPALATVLVETGMGLVLMAWLHGRPGLRRFVAWRRPGLALLRRMFALGLPVTGTFAVETGLFLGIGLLVGRLGAAPLAAHQIALSITSVSFMVPLAVAQAANVRVGNRVGAGARRAGLVAIGLAAVAEALAAAVLVVAPGTLAGFYIEPALPANAEATATAISLLAIAAVFQVADGMQSAAAGALRGLGDTRVPFLLAAVGYWGVGFPAAWWLTAQAGAGAAGAWWGLAGGLMLVATLLTARFLRRSRMIPVAGG